MVSRGSGRDHPCLVSSTQNRVEPTPTVEAIDQHTHLGIRLVAAGRPRWSHQKGCYGNATEKCDHDASDDVTHVCLPFYLGLRSARL